MNSSALSLVTNRFPKASGEAYLKFELQDGTYAGLWMHQVQEVLTLPLRHLTPMPNLAPEVLGLMHRHSRVLWVIDLSMLLGVATSGTSPQQHDIVIIRSEMKAIAVAVRRVEGIALALPETLQPISTCVTKGLIPYTLGCILQLQEAIFLLDGEAILQSSIFQNH